MTDPEHEFLPDARYTLFARYVFKTGIWMCANKG